MPGLTLQVVAGEFAVCRLAPGEPRPDWAESGVFSSITRTADELSVVCPAAQVPAAVKREAGWRLVKVSGPLDFGMVGVLASLAQPLAAAGISMLAVGTFDTDYVLIKSDRLVAAIQALEMAGHVLRPDDPVAVQRAGFFR